MIWHPGSLALLAGSLAALLVTLLSMPFALKTIRRWNPDSADEGQFALERATHLVSALASFAIAVETCSLFLFVAVANDMSRFLTGAMCATGTLGASPLGWWALGLKGVLVLLGWMWLAVNSLDNRSPDFPLIKTKYRLLLLLTPLFALDFALLWGFFAGIEPDVITSCCGSLFSTANPAQKPFIADYMERETMLAHHIGVGLAWLTGIAALATGRRLTNVAASLAALAFFPLAAVSTVSFIAPYVYGLPWHHCPFDMFLGVYGWVGFPIFLALFAATAWGALPGILAGFAGRKGLEALYPAAARKWIVRSLASRAVFDILVYYAVFGRGMNLY